jgi:multidrug efflux pump subunit AcrA (membrane-fusion protein)
LGFKIAKWATVIGFALMLAFALAIPTPFRVEIQGTLQPVAQREVYAEMDGVVARVFVEDDQQVREGDPLVTVRSPDLEIEVQEVIGEMRALAKKRDGLELTINQLQNQDRDLIRERQLSSEIAELDTRLNTLREKEAALRAEQEKLTVFAPIDGAIASQDIERHLRTRPVQRGDALLRIVSFSGPWQLELLVPDADSGHVRTALFGNQESDGNSAASSAGRSIEYVIASSPDRKFVARAEWMADSARNPSGNGVFLDLIASVDPQVAAQSHMGATVYAYVDCGLEPFWYVWSRPLVEFIQRKLWF